MKLLVRSAMSEQCEVLANCYHCSSEFEMVVCQAEMVRRVELFIDQGFERAEDCLKAAKIQVQSIRSTCGNPSDEAMLIKMIKAKEGGFERLDQVFDLITSYELCLNLLCVAGCARI